MGEKIEKFNYGRANETIHKDYIKRGKEDYYGR